MRRRLSINCCGISSTINAFVVLLRPSLQFLCLLLSCWVSLLRVSDFKHHLIDVIVGFILGGSIGIVTAFHALGWDSIGQFRSSHLKSKKRGSGSSIEELVELHEERCEQNHATTKNDEDIEKVMELSLIHI